MCNMCKSDQLQNFIFKIDLKRKFIDHLYLSTVEYYFVLFNNTYLFYKINELFIYFYSFYPYYNIT